MLSFCTPYFSVILPALLHFCSFICTAFRVQVANLCAKIGRFLRTKRAWSKKFAGASSPDPLFLPYPRGHGPPRFFLLEPPLFIVPSILAYVLPVLETGTNFCWVNNGQPLCYASKFCPLSYSHIDI